MIAIASGLALAALALLRVSDDPWAPPVAATNGGDIEIYEAPARPDPQALAALPEVETVGTLVENGDTALQIGGETMLVVLKRMPDREQMVVDRPFMVTGRWFQSDDEVVFEATLADALGIEVGDQVGLTGRGSRTVRVVGTAATTMTLSYPEGLPGTLFAGSALYDAVDPVGGPRWSIGLRLRDPAQTDAVVANLNRVGPVPAGECESGGWCARSVADLRDESFPTRTDGFAQTMLFFATLLPVATALLVVTLLGSRLVSEARQLTLLQVAGLTPVRLALLIAAEHVLLAVAGVAAGTLIAAVVAPLLADSAATVFGAVAPNFAISDVLGVAVVVVTGTAIVSGIGGVRAGRRSLAIIARSGTGRVRRSRAAGLAIAWISRATPALGVKDIATRRGRTFLIVLSVGLSVAIAVSIVGVRTAEFEPGGVPRGSPSQPAGPAEIPELPMLTQELVDDLGGQATLITTLQVLLAAVAVLTLLASAAMSARERLRELGTLHALGCTTGQLVGASAVSHGAMAAIGAVIGAPLGLGIYLLFSAATGGGFTGNPPLLAVVLVVAAAVAIAAAAAAAPALLVQRLPMSEALAAE